MFKGRKKTDSTELVSKKSKFNATPYIMLIPAIAFFTIFTFYPFIKDIILSFTFTNNKGKAVKWAGLYNYKTLFSQSDFWLIFKNTFVFAGIVGFGTFAFAMIFAALCMEQKPGCRIYQTMFSLPMAIASAAAAAIGMFLFKESGVVNQLFHTQTRWLTDMHVTLYTVSMLTIWLRIGSSYIFLLVGFRAVDKELIESALIDGAGPVKRFFRIMIPIASPQIFFVIFLNITGSFKSFGQIKMLTGGGPSHSSETIVYSIYRTGVMGTRFDRACAYALILFVIIFIFTRIQFFFEKRFVFYK